jgi:hypothetical protein
LRPPFARDYPKTAEIDALLALFEKGDYGGLRTEAKKLEQHESDAVRAAARDLVSRTEPDPAMRWVFIAILVMILAVSAYWLARTH